jgi:NTE family protein
VAKGQSILAKTTPKRINLALQGGGAHGAFTWGALDHLLADPRVELSWITGTSAGAINAVAVAAGLAEGGREGARAKLREIWAAIHKAGVPDFIRLNPLMMSTAANMSRMFSPYDLNPMGHNPLRALLNDHIDFARLRAASPVELLIVATEVATGRPRYFRRSELTVDAVLASACLPMLQHAVEIDGTAYWDGGYSANPDLIEIALSSPVEDTVIVLLTPTVQTKRPTSMDEITNETYRLTFNAPLMRDVAIIEAMRESENGFFARRFKRASRLSPLVGHRFHMIEAGRHTSSLPAGSKMKPDWGLFTYLHGAGRTEAYKWLDGTYPMLGRESSVDLKARFLTPLPAFRLPPRLIKPVPAETSDLPIEPKGEPKHLTASPDAHSPR